MQTMNTDQQPYYPNQTVPAGYYAPNGPEPRKLHSKKISSVFHLFVFI
jgi:hypothetical protein